MGTNLPEGLKDKLVAEGRWADFNRRREDLKFGGMMPAEARRAAIAEFAPEFSAVAKRRVGRPTKKEAAEREKLLKKRVAADDEGVVSTERGQKCPSTASEGSGREKMRLEVEKPAEGVLEGLERRACSNAKAFKWAFIHSQLGEDRTREEAPDDFAWAMYLLFRRSTSTMVDLARATLVKLVAKDEDVDGGAKDAMDGQAEYDILSNLMEDRR